MKWRYIKGFEGLYEASETGAVRNSRTGYELKPQRYPNGYLGVCLGRGRRYLVHRLVATAFVLGDNTLQVNHRNGKRDDNRAANLEWVTCSDNHKHSHRTLNRKPHALTRRVEIVKNDIARVFESVVLTAAFLGVCPGSVASAAARNHKCQGHEVRYV